MTTLDIQRQPRDSTEYVTIAVTADVALFTQPVSMAVVPYGDETMESDWIDVAWLDATDETNRLHLLVGPGAGHDVDCDYGTYMVRWRLTDNPEIPARDACLLSIGGGRGTGVRPLAPAQLVGTTADRPDPDDVTVGACYFDTDLGQPLWSDSIDWLDATGTPV